MGIWTIVTGFFGMNFGEGTQFSSYWYFMVVFGILLILSIVVIVIFRKKKLI
jgi:LPXTG-motif cell wall-anchored protein